MTPDERADLAAALADPTQALFQGVNVSGEREPFSWDDVELVPDEDAALVAYRARAAERGSWLRRALVDGCTPMQIAGILREMAMHKRASRRLYEMDLQSGIVRMRVRPRDPGASPGV